MSNKSQTPNTKVNNKDIGATVDAKAAAEEDLKVVRKPPSDLKKAHLKRQGSRVFNLSRDQ